MLPYVYLLFCFWCQNVHFVFHMWELLRYCFEIFYKWKVTIDVCVCVQFLVGDLNSYYSKIQDIFHGSAVSTEQRSRD